MSKKKSKLKKSVKKVTPTASSAAFTWLPYALALLAFLLYANTLGHQFALDDASVLTDNFVVQKGLSGWPEIFTTNYRFGYWNNLGSLYRPISLAVFALVWQVSPDNPFPLHLINVLLFVLTAVVIFQLLRKMWPDLHILLPGLVTALFVAHPVHVEVVANIKSLDEILALLFGLFTMSYYVDFLKTDKINALIIALVCYTLALFSKENSVTFVAVFPTLAAFISDKKWTKRLASAAVFLLPLAFYLGVRYAILKTQGIGTISPLDNLLIATPSTASWFATAFLLLGKYLAALVIPWQLGSDFGYSQIPSVSPANITVIAMFVALQATVFYNIWGVRKKRWSAFGTSFLFISFSIYSNLFVPIGSSYGERFLYVASLGFCIAVVMGLYEYGGKLDKRDTGLATIFNKNKLLFIVTGILFLFYSGKTVTRNAAWYDSYTLYKTDIQTAPNSAKLNFHLGLEEVQKALTETDGTQKIAYQNAAFQHFNRAIELYPTYADAYGQLGLAYYRQKEYDKAMQQYQKSLEYDPKDAKIYSNMGVIYFKKGNLQKAEEVYLKAVQLAPRYVDARRNLGSVYAQTRRFDQAITQFTEGLKYDPNNATLNLYLGYAYRDKKDLNTANKYLQRAYQLDPKLKR